VTSNAMFQALSAGVPTDNAKEFMKVVGEAATGGFAQMDVVVDGLTNALNGFGMSADRARDVSDKFFVANRLGKTTMGELAASIGKVGPLAKLSGQSLDEVLASTVSLTVAGQTTAESMTGLRGILNAVGQGSSKASAEAKRLGIDFSAAALKSKGFTRFMTEIRDAITGPKGAADSLNKLFGDVEGRLAASRLLSDEGFGVMTNALDELADSAGSTADAFGRVEETVGFKIQQLKTGFQSLFISLGEGLSAGFGLNEIEDIPTAVKSAGKSLSEGAEVFAKAFTKAFKPVSIANNTDWKGLAKVLGDSAGAITAAFIDVGNFFAKTLIPAVRSFIGFVKDAIGFVGSFFGAATPTEKARKRDQAAANSKGGVNVMPTGLTQQQAAMVRNMRGQPEHKRREILGGILAIGGSHGQTQSHTLRMVKSAMEAQRQGAVIAGGGQSGAAAVRIAYRQQDAARERNRVLAEKRDARFAAQERSTGIPTFNGDSHIPTLDGKKPEVNVTVINNNNIEAKDKDDKPKKPGGGSGSFSARGRGDATIESTSTQRYLLSEDEVIPISDEMHFGHLATREVG
ncbi:MAG: phage tail tape measure protein, partial [Planctomycetota bacterium]